MDQTQDQTQPPVDAMIRAIMGGGPLPFPEAPQYALPAFMPDNEQDIASQIRNQFQKYTYDNPQQALAATNESARTAMYGEPGTVGRMARQGWADEMDAFGRFFGGDYRKPQTWADMGEQAAYNVPGIGNALSARDAYNALAPDAQGHRDYLGGALAGIGAIPLLGAMTAPVREEMAGIRAYHGSPHNFDQFDTSKIGTGEGAQAYGHGLYFAESPGVAQSYKEQLATPHIAGVPENPNDPFHVAAGALSDAKGNRKEALTSLETYHNLEDNPSLKDTYSQAKDILASGAELPARDFKGHMYEVNIAADPEHFLDWDKPLAQQSEHVKESLAKTPGFSESIGAQSMNSPVTKYTPTFGELSQRGLVPATYDRSSPEFSKTYLDAGLPGVKYFDQGSRAAGEGFRNYVVFDAKLVDIVKKYGIPGAIGLGLITPEIGRQMQEQGL